MRIYTELQAFDDLLGHDCGLAWDCHGAFLLRCSNALKAGCCRWRCRAAGSPWDLKLKPLNPLKDCGNCGLEPPQWPGAA
mmetsp:Transcript_3239/g.7529  ORF Transcript_3239/g.7529 Transcript_3239/m.7529 type:complete len:80 (-) Transcript_3239:636-875(-)